MIYKGQNRLQSRLYRFNLCPRIHFPPCKTAPYSRKSQLGRHAIRVARQGIHDWIPLTFCCQFAAARACAIQPLNSCW